MEKIKDICRNIERHIPANRIDGVFIGNKDSLYKMINKKVKIGWYVFIVGDINGIFHNFIKIEEYKYIVNITEEWKDKFLNIISSSDIEVLYILDENYIPMILIEDFPEDITINTDME
jgi:hypothetical protein